jgi:hypothetical protein
MLVVVFFHSELVFVRRQTTCTMVRLAMPNIKYVRLDMNTSHRLVLLHYEFLKEPTRSRHTIAISQLAHQHTLFYLAPTFSYLYNICQLIRNHLFKSHP